MESHPCSRGWVRWLFWQLIFCALDGTGRESYGLVSCSRCHDCIALPKRSTMAGPTRNKWTFYTDLQISEDDPHSARFNIRASLTARIWVHGFVCPAARLGSFTKAHNHASTLVQVTLQSKMTIVTWAGPLRLWREVQVWTRSQIQRDSGTRKLRISRY